MPRIVELPDIPPASLVEVDAEKFALYAAMHELLSPQIIGLLHLDSTRDLTIRLYENGVYMGIHDPTICSLPRLIFAAGVFQTVLVDSNERRTHVWSSTENVNDLRPVRGLMVPGGMSVGLQSIQNNRSTFVVLGHQSDEPELSIPFDDPLIAELWQRQGSERIKSVVSGKRLP